MASEKVTNKYILERAEEILKNSSLADLSPIDQKDLFSALNLYLKYCVQPITEYDANPNIEDIESFFEIKPFKELREIKNYFSRSEESETEKPKKEEKKEEPVEETPVEVEEEEKEKPKTPEPEKGPAPVKEDSTVPAELETLVYQYKQAQADRLEEDPVHSVANDVKRALNTRNIRHQAELRREERLAKLQGPERERQREIEDLEKDSFLVSTVNPKAEMASVISQNIERVSRQAIMAEIAIIRETNPEINITMAQINRAVEELKYYAFTGSDLTEYKHLSLNSQLALAEQGVSFDPKISEVIEKGNALSKSLETNAYSDEPDQIQKQIDDLSDKIQEKHDKHTEKFIQEINKINQDIDLNLEKAQREQAAILRGLSKAIPNPRSPLQESPTPLTAHAKEFETAVRLVPGLSAELRPNPTYDSSEASSLLKEVKGNTREISSEAVYFLGIGLTPERLQKAETYAKSNPDSPIGKLYVSHQDVFKQVHFQIGKLRQTKLGQDIEKGVKPLTGISGSLANFYNRSSPAIQAITKVVIDPVGTARSWAGRMAGKQIGKRLIENSGSLLAQKLGGYLTKHGLELGVKKFASEAAKKLAIKAVTWTALKLGISLTLESFSGLTFGMTTLIDIAVQVALWIGEKTIGAVYNTFQSAAESVYGEKIKARDVAGILALPLAAAASAGAAAFSGFTIAVRATQVAVISAVGIVIGSVVVAGLYLGFAYLVAPALSTLVQLDSVERVKYEQYTPVASASDCAWPTKGHYTIITGPRGGTHRLSQLEAIDIGAPDGSPHLSATDGVVTFTGVYSNYGNTVKIQSKTSVGNTLVVYGHLSEIKVGVGQQIKQGEQIGLVGGSGGWSPHIHQEYQGIKYNQCPDGGLKIKEECCVPYAGGICSGPCNAFSN